MTTAPSTNKEELGHLPTTGLAAPPVSDPTVGGDPAAPRIDDPARLVGQVIASRYRVDAVLGEGGMGAVLRCHHVGLRRDVAVKILRPELTNDPEISARFEREAQSGSRLEHPNCVRVFDFGRWAPPGGPTLQYLAMQLLDGVELADLLGAPLEWRRAVDLTTQILKGLAHAHDHGIVHRDLKPENVFVTRDHDGVEILKLVDFGIAKIVEGDGANAGMTRAGLVFGTPRYMSPEQALGAPVDLRTDIYAAGVVLYQMLSGRPPFDDDDFVTLLRQQISGEPPPLPSHVPAELRAIVSRMMAKERDERFPSAHAVIAALDELRAASSDAAGSQASLAAPPTMADLGVAPSSATMPSVATAPAQTRPRPHRRTWVVAAAGAGGLAVVLLGWGIASSSSSTASQDELSADPAVAAPIAASEFVLADLDQQIARGDRKGAQARIEGLLQTFPRDPQVHVRKARLATAMGRYADALEAYEAALDLDAGMLDDEASRTEILAAMRQPTARDRAVALALSDRGEKLRVFLLERVNDEVQPLSWSERHAALDILSADLTHTMKIDRKLNLAVDLWQATEAPEPCKAFAEALDAMERAPDAYYLGTLQNAEPPAVPKGASADVIEICGGLPQRLEAVRNEHATKFGRSGGAGQVPKAFEGRKKKPKRRRGGLFRRLFR